MELESDRPPTRTLAGLLVAWGLLMAASAALLGPAVGRAARGAVNPWLPVLCLQALALVPAVASWTVALRRRLDLPRGLFLLAVLPIGWGLLAALAFAVLVYLAS